jgi:hypothetical protein
VKIMSCQSYRIEIEEMEATTRPSGEMAVHLSACAECHAFYSERQSLRQLMKELEMVAAPADFDFRLRARLAASNGAGNHRSSWRSFVFSAPAIGLTASLILLGVAATAFYNRSQPAPIVAGRPAEVVRQKTEQPDKTGSASTPVEIVNPKASPVATNKKTESPGIASVPNANQQSRAGNGQTNSPRKQMPATPNSGQRLSNDLAASGARVITPYAQPSPAIIGASPLLEVSVRSKSQPLKIDLDDRSGVKRTVTLEPVVFGSQDLIGRETSRAATANGIW